MTTVRIDVIHVGLGMEFKELAFDSSMSLGDLKEKLYPRTGTEAKDQKLQMIQPDVKELNDDKSSLESLGVVNGAILQLTDTNDSSVSNNLGVGATKVEKYEAKHGNADFAAFRKKVKRKPTPATEDTGKLEAELLTIGMRVLSKKSQKTGVVRFIGPIEPLPLGYWCGIEMDDESGKNDGSVKGVRLFQCADNRGAFIRPNGLEPVDEGKKTEMKEEEEEEEEL